MTERVQRAAHPPGGPAPVELRSATAVYPLPAVVDRPLLLGRAAPGLPPPDVDVAGETAARTVSREHAWLAPGPEGVDVWPADGALNGLLVNGRPLAPGQRARLREGDTLQAGDLVLAVRSVQPVGPDVLEVAVEPADLTLAPGGAAQLTVTLANHTGRSRSLRLDAAVGPRGWCRFHPPQGGEAAALVVLTVPPSPPGARPTPETHPVITATLELPAGPAAPAGRHRVLIRATTEDTPVVQAAAAVDLDVAPLGGPALSVEPTEVTGQAGTFAVVCDNRSNRPMALSIEAEAPDVVLDYPPDALTVEPGERAALPITARAARRRWWGPPVRHVIAIAARVGGAEPHPLHAVLAAPALAPAWLQTFAGRLATWAGPAAVLAVAALLAYVFLRPPEVQSFVVAEANGRAATLHATIDRRCARVSLTPAEAPLTALGGGSECSLWEALTDGFPWAGPPAQWRARVPLSAEPVTYALSARNALGLASTRTVTAPAGPGPRILSLEADPAVLSHETQPVRLRWRTAGADAVRLVRIDPAPAGVAPVPRDLLVPIDDLDGAATDTLRWGQAQYVLLAAAIDDLGAPPAETAEQARHQCQQVDDAACEARRRLAAAAERAFAACTPRYLVGEPCDVAGVAARVVRVSVAPPVLAAFSAEPLTSNPGAPVALHLAVNHATSVRVRAKEPTGANRVVAAAATSAAARPPLASLPVVRRTLDGVDGNGDDPGPTPTPSATAPAGMDATATPSAAGGTATPTPTPNGAAANSPTATGTATATPLSTPTRAPTPPPQPSQATVVCDHTGVWEVPATPFTLRVHPACDTEYELMASNAGGTLRASLTVRVAPLRVLQFTASPSSVPQGGEVVLSWSVDGATLVDLAPLGTVTGDSSRTVRPERTTDYVLTAYGWDRSGPSVSQTVRVTVGPPLPKVDAFVAAPAAAVAGSPVTLAFSAQHARSVTITSAEGATVFSESVGQATVQRSLTVTPARSTVYTLTVTNDSGAATAAVVVTVATPTPTPTASATPSPTVAPTPAATTPTPAAAPGSPTATPHSTETVPATPTPG